MAIAVLLISTFIALWAALVAALVGQGVMAVVITFCVTGWLASIVFTALMVVRAAMPQVDVALDAPAQPPPGRGPCVTTLADAP